MSFSVCHFSPSPISHPSIESIERAMVGKSSRHFASNSRIPENPSTKPIQPYSSADSTRIYIYTRWWWFKGACIQVSEKFSQCRRWPGSPGSRCAREFSDGKRKAANRAKLVRRASWMPPSLLFSLYSASSLCLSPILRFFSQPFIAFSFYQVISYEGNLQHQ